MWFLSAFSTVPACEYLSRGTKSMGTLAIFCSSPEIIRWLHTLSWLEIQTEKPIYARRRWWTPRQLMPFLKILKVPSFQEEWHYDMREFSYELALARVFTHALLTVHGQPAMLRQTLTEFLGNKQVVNTSKPITCHCITIQ